MKTEVSGSFRRPAPRLAASRTGFDLEAVPQVTYDLSAGRLALRRPALRLPPAAEEDQR